MAAILYTSSTVMQTQIIPVLVVMCILHSASMALPIKSTANSYIYELIFTRDNTNGSVTLTCREAESANEINVNSIKYFLNSSKCATDLRERESFSKVETVGCCSIKFILQRNLEGNYTCGARINDTIQESLPVTLICEYNNYLHPIASYSYMQLQCL